MKYLGKIQHDKDLVTKEYVDKRLLMVDTMPIASADEENKIYLYIGETDTNYTKGSMYMCIKQTDGTYKWEQKGGASGDFLPLTGGEMTGTIVNKVSDGAIMKSPSGTRTMVLKDDTFRINLADLEGFPQIELTDDYASIITKESKAILEMSDYSTRLTNGIGSNFNQVKVTPTSTLLGNNIKYFKMQDNTTQIKNNQLNVLSTGDTTTNTFETKINNANENILLSNTPTDRAIRLYINGSKACALSLRNENLTYATSSPNKTGQLSVQDAIFTPYSNTATYNVGDYCTYLGRLYKCKTAITTAEEFTESKWLETNVFACFSKTEVAATGTSTDTVKYITVDGVESKLAGSEVSADGTAGESGLTTLTAQSQSTAYVGGLLNNVIYAVPYNSGSVLYKYDPETDTSASIASGSTPTNTNSGFVYNNKLYCMPASSGAKAFYFDATTSSITSMSSASPAANNRTALVGSVAYSFPANTSYNMYKYNVDTDTYTDLGIQSPIAVKAAVTVGSTIYCFGSSGQATYKFNTTDNTFTSLGVNAPVAVNAATLYKGKILCLTSSTQQLYYFDMTTNTYEAIADTSVPIHGYAAITYKGRVYCIPGRSSQYLWYFAETNSTLETITIDGTEWSVPSGGGGTEYSAGAGIDISSNTINVKPDNTSVYINTSGQLAANMPVIAVNGQTGSVMLDAGDIMTEDASATVQAAIDSKQNKLEENGNAILVDSDNTVNVLVDSDSVKVDDSNRLAINLKENGGLTVDAYGVAAKLKDGGGVSCDAEGLAIETKVLADATNISNYITPNSGRCTISNAKIIRQGAVYNMYIRINFTSTKATWAANTEWLNLFLVTDAFKAICQLGCNGVIRDPQSGNYGAAVSYAGGIVNAGAIGIWPWKQIPASTITSTVFDLNLTWVNI